MTAVAETETDPRRTDLDDNFTKPELQAACDQFGVETKKTFSKGQLIDSLLGDGVDADLIRSSRSQDDDEDAPREELVPAEAEEPVEEDEPELILIRMRRANNTYEIRGYRFTQEHPYVLVAEKDADYLIEVDGGFTLASPKEAKEFYS